MAGINLSTCIYYSRNVTFLAAFISFDVISLLCSLSFLHLNELLRKEIILSPGLLLITSILSTFMFINVKCGKYKEET